MSHQTNGQIQAIWCFQLSLQSMVLHKIKKRLSHNIIETAFLFEFF
jgi:hypothetical protein